MNTITADVSVIRNKILEIRGNRVILDYHLAELYGVQTKVLKQAVRRNLQRFPEDFMFELTENEWTELATNCDRLLRRLYHSQAREMITIIKKERR